MQQQNEYPVYIPCSQVSSGGKIRLSLLNGEVLSFRSPSFVKSGERKKISVKGDVLGEAIFYHLWDTKIAFQHEITSCIESLEIKEQTKSLLKNAIKYLLEPETTHFFNLAILDLLDYSVLREKETGWFSGEEAIDFKKRYIIATQHARTHLLDTFIEKEVAKLPLAKSLRSVWQHIKHQKPIDDWEAIQQLDQIVLNTHAPRSLKAYYSKASIMVKSITTDLWVLRVIQEASKSDPQKLKDLAEQWHMMRDGSEGYFSNFWKSKETVKELRQELERLVYTSDIPKQAKVIFRLVASGKMNEKGKELSNNTDPEVLHKQFEKAKEAVENATSLFGNAQSAMISVGAKSGTGVAIASLAGAAKTTSTLAWLGAGSVASGGLGMLGGLAVLTGGAALLGAVAVVSIAALMGPLEGDNLKNAGLGAVGGLGIGAGVAWGVWSLALASSGYTGAAAFTSTLAMFGGGSLAAGGLGMTGGLAVLTGGAALVAVASGVGIKWVLDKWGHQKVLSHMEEQAERIEDEIRQLRLTE